MTFVKEMNIPVATRLTNKLQICCLVLLLFILSFTGCNKKETNSDKYLKEPNCVSSFIPKNHDYQTVGFYPSWEQDILSLQSIPWDKLTRIVYAFALPYKDGNINTGSLTSISQLVELAHAHGVEIYFSIGGGDGSENFPVMARNDNTRNLFIKEVRQYIFENCLDGVDIDWEYWSGYATNTVVLVESNALVTLLKDLKAELTTFGLGISIDVGASDWGGKHFLNEVKNYADHVMVMSYDFTGTWSAPGPHSAYEDAVGSGNSVNSTGLAYWVNYRGWPKGKVLLGVPFYGKDFDREGGFYMSYADILLLHPDAYKSDRVNNIYYNGVGTMAQKTQYVVDNLYSGIMIWELTQDSKVDSTSLLNTIYKVMHQ